MSVLTAAQAYADAIAAGFSATGAQILTAIGMAESGLNTQAHNPGNPIGAENSWGIDQINLNAHPEVTVAQATDPLQADQIAYRLSNGGTNFSPWSTYDSGAYKQYLSLSGGTNTPAQTSTMTSGVSSPSSTPVSLNPGDWVSGVISFFTTGLEKVGFFAIALIVIGFGIMLIAWEPAKTAIGDAAKGALLAE